MSWYRNQEGERARFTNAELVPPGWEPIPDPYEAPPPAEEASEKPPEPAEPAKKDEPKGKAKKAK